MPTALWFETALVGDAWADRVRIVGVDGVIQTLQTGVDPMPRDDRATIGVPGIANVHSHAFQRGMAGLAETAGPAGDDFWTWREVMYRFLGRLTPDDVEAVAALAYAEMLESGFTRVGEFHYLHNAPNGRHYDRPEEMAERIVAAADLTGIGLTLLPVFYAHAGFGGAPPNSGQRRFINTPDRFARLVETGRVLVSGLPDARLGVAPHSLRAVTPEELDLVIGLAEGGPIHIHAAEQVREVSDCIAWSGLRPVEWLLANAPVGADWCLIHATHLTQGEIDGLAARGAVAGLCPITEANLGDGLFPAPDFLAARGRFGLGTDSNVLIDAAQELRAMEYGQRLSRRARNVLATPGRASVAAGLFIAAVAGGAQALAGEPPGLRVGASLDVVGLRADHVSLCGRRGDAILDGWIFAAGAAAIDQVWRRGRKVVADGRHIHKAAIEVRYRRTLRALLTD